jgi:hypothetical protein
MQIAFRAYWLQKAGNAGDEYEDAFAPFDPPDANCDEFRCAVADGATETSFSGLWAQILVDAFVHERLANLKPQTTQALSARWRQAIDQRGVALPWYAQEKLERGAFSSLMGLTIHADGRWRALCVGDSCLFHLRPRQTMRAFPYHLPEQFNNHPALISTLRDGIAAQTARGTWHPGDYFLLMTDALAHFFLSQRKMRARLAAETLDQAGFEQLVAEARADRLCRNDDVTLLKIIPLAGEGQHDGVAQPE